MPKPRLPLAVILCACLLGGVTGLVGSFLQAARWGDVPYGVVVALVGSALLFAASGWAAASRSGAVAAGGMWLVAVNAILTAQQASGDRILPDEGTAAIWVNVGALFAILLMLPPYADLARWSGHVEAEDTQWHQGHAPQA